MDELTIRQEAAAQAVRSARICLLIVTLLMFVMDMAMLYIVKLPIGLADAPAEDKRLVLVPDGRHETLNDLGAEQMADLVLAWLRERSG